jgi:hypothetical protein
MLRTFVGSDAFGGDKQKKEGGGNGGSGDGGEGEDQGDMGSKQPEGGTGSKYESGTGEGGIEAEIIRAILKTSMEVYAKEQEKQVARAMRMETQR